MGLDILNNTPTKNEAIPCYCGSKSHLSLSHCYMCEEKITVDNYSTWRHLCRGCYNKYPLQATPLWYKAVREFPELIEGDMQGR